MCVFSFLCGSQARIGDSSHLGIRHSFCAVFVWNPGCTPCNGLYTESPPEVVHFSGFKKGMFASSGCKLQRHRMKVWRDSDRASISPSYPRRPVPDLDLQITGGCGHSDSKITWGTRSHKKNFRLLGPLFGLKLRGGLPLKTIGDSARQRRITRKHCFQNLKYHFFCAAFLILPTAVVGSLPLLSWGPGHSSISWALLENSMLVYNMFERHSRDDNAKKNHFHS